MVDTPSTATVVQAVDHPAIRMQLDVGALAMNNEEPENILNTYGSLIGHIHASEPHLKVLGSQHTNHNNAAYAVKQYCPGKTVTIEMLEDQSQPLQSISNALDVAKNSYGANQP
jgi:sugar phosphate isomerase/epimerase